MQKDAIDLAICNMLGDPKEARDGIEEVHFFPFNPTDKRTAMTYITPDGLMHRATKGAPEQILELAYNKDVLQPRVHEIINRFADRGLRSLGVGHQVCPNNCENISANDSIGYEIVSSRKYRIPLINLLKQDLSI